MPPLCSGARRRDIYTAFSARIRRQAALRCASLLSDSMHAAALARALGHAPPPLPRELPPSPSPPISLRGFSTHAPPPRSPNCRPRLWRCVCAPQQTRFREGKMPDVFPASRTLGRPRMTLLVVLMMYLGASLAFNVCPRPQGASDGARARRAHFQMPLEWMQGKSQPFLVSPSERTAALTT